MSITRLLFFLLLCTPITSVGQTPFFYGKIHGMGKPLPYAHIWIKETQTVITSNAEGAFQLPDLPKGTVTLFVSADGYKTLELQVSNEETKSPLYLELVPQSEELQPILLESKEAGLARNSPYNLSHINLQGILNKNHPNGIMGVIRHEPGLSGAEMGPGIVKPIIRGLGFSRVVTLYQGNKLQNHQWGADHGLGINDLGVKSVEVIRGPASVLYGSGALGGILITKDADAYLERGHPSGNLTTSYNGATKGFRTTASLGGKFRSSWFMATDVGYEQHGDYSAGGGRIIGNSRFNSGTLRLHTGMDKKRFTNKLSFTYNSQKLGIISDQEMEKGHSLVTRAWDYAMQLPFQEVQDYLLSYNQSTQGDLVETHVHLSHHLNKRREIETDFDALDLGLDQAHTFLNARIDLHAQQLLHQFGVQGSFIKTQNQPGALDILIPDAKMLETGLYYMASMESGPYYLQAALRYDYRRLTAYAGKTHFIEYGFILPGDPDGHRLSKDFQGFSGSMGATRVLGENHRLKINFSTGFRAPDLAELFSNGPHPGTSRFEIGNPNFEREQSYQIDLQYNYNADGLEASVSAFAMRLQDYIDFSSTEQVIPQKDMEVWSYNQNDANFYGVELESSWNPHLRWSSSLVGSMVRAVETESKRNLSMIPPSHLRLKLLHQALKDQSLKLSGQWLITAPQNRPAPTEESTPGYGLLHLSVSKSFRLKKEHYIEGSITVENLLDRRYVDHLSLLRPFQIPGVGRNIRASLKYSF